MRKKNEAENAKKLKENQNGNQSVSSEEQPADNVIINELEEPKTSFETEEVNGNISVATISEKFEEVALESVEEEAEGNLGKVSDSSLTKTLTNGDLPNGSATTEEDGNGVVSNLMSKGSQGTKSIKTLMETPASSLETGQNFLINHLLYILVGKCLNLTNNLSQL